MRKLFCFITLLTSYLVAGAMPTASTADNPIWYLVKFMNGGSVLEAKADGQNVATAGLTASDDQYWRFEGSNTAGFKMVSRSGKTLFTNAASKNEMFKSAASTSATTLFTIKACTISGYTDGYTISPKANTSLFMNQWGGAGSGKELGLWDQADANCPVVFMTEAEYNESMKLASLPLIPMPTDIKLVEGTVKMKNISTVTYPVAEYAALAQQYAEMLGAVSGTTIQTKQGTQAAANTVVMTVDATIQSDEAYGLKMDTDGSIVVKAAKAHGFFNALQTLRQLFYDAKFNNEGELRLVTVNDNPLLGYRGFMLDIARHYFDKNEVKKILDVMALYKINKFHWHLTDDQGWRIQIPEYPLLTEVGAIRSSSITKMSSPRLYDDTEYGRGMYYTLDDLREVVAYAEKLHIDIMPEIDLPGHMVAAISSYPELFSCNPAQAIENNGKYIVRVNEGISKDVLNVAKPEVMEFLKCVLSHMADVFPYPVIHIGGDECPTQAWTNRVNANDKQFMDWMKDNGLETVNDIQPWLVNELGKWLKQNYNKDVVCWNELTSHWKTSYETKPIIMCYSDYGQNAMKAATNLGLRTIYTGCWPFYLDMYQTYESGNINAVSSHQFDDCYSGGYGNNTLERVYGATPLSNIAGKENLCLGVGANLWTETVNNNKEAEHQFFPRMLALAEVGWLPQNQKSWPSFRKRVQTHFKVFEEMDVNYATYDLDPDDSPLKYYNDVKEAKRLLKDAQPDVVGYPSLAAYDALRSALNAHLPNLSEDTESTGNALRTAVADFKAAPITLPTSNKTYRIISASVAWNADYVGSAMYVTSDVNNVRFHYTQQTEPEELFRIVETSTAGNYQFVSRFGERKVYLPNIDNKVTVGSIATTLRIDPATVASTSPAYYDYIPGVVLISSKLGYTTNGTGTKRLNAQPDGYIYAKSNATVGHTGCWRIVEVTDFTNELESLSNKCERLGILDDDLVQPARQLIASGTVVSEEQYDTYAAIYAQYYNKKYVITTTVDTPKASESVNNSDAVTYDISGRRIASDAKGITIMGNKKVAKH